MAVRFFLYIAAFAFFPANAQTDSITIGILPRNTEIMLIGTDSVKVLKRRQAIEVVHTASDSIIRVVFKDGTEANIKKDNPSLKLYEIPKDETFQRIVDQLGITPPPTSAPIGTPRPIPEPNVPGPRAHLNVRSVNRLIRANNLDQ